MFPFEMVWLMQNHQFYLKSGQSVRLGQYKVTLLEIEDDAALLEIEGPDGAVKVESVGIYSSDEESCEELVALA